MALEINQDGVTIDTFDDIYQRVEDGLKEIYGYDIDLDQESPDGQMVGILSTAWQDIQAIVGSMPSKIDPDLNEGVAQYIIGKICGIAPKAATRSQRDLTLTLSAPFTLPDSYTVVDQANQNWIIASEQDLIVGDNTVTFYAETWGDVTGYESDTFEQVTPEIQVTAIATNGEVLVGDAGETNEQYRQRRNLSVENPSFSTVGSLYAKIANMATVTDLNIEENYTHNYDVERDMQAHSIWVICEGGDVNQIAEQMVKQRTAGSGTKGETSGVYVEERVRPSGNILTINHIMYMDRPTYVDLHVRLTATRTNASQAFDESQIKDNLVAEEFEIKQTINAGALYCAALTDNNGYYYVTDLEISLDGVTWTDESLFSGYDGKFVISEENITITEG